MQIGIDLGATKIEYVLIDNDSKELIRNRVRTPNNYNSTISEIISIIKNLEDKNKGLNTVSYTHLTLPTILLV